MVTILHSFLVVAVCATAVSLVHSAISTRAQQTLGSQPISVHPDTLRLVDEYFREVYFHGVNAVVKSFPWIPDPTGFSTGMSLSEADFIALHSLGLNCIRLGTMWPGVERTRGYYNDTYLSVLKTIVSTGAQYGVYFLIDMHQDVFNEKFCGEGFPRWAAIPENNSQFPSPIDTPYNYSADGLPTWQECSRHGWSEYYFTKATGSAFQNLYDNKYGLRDSWAKVWATLAETVSSLGSAVLGYELMNEPWAGDAVDDLLLMVPGVADRVNLQPTWDVGAAAIRAVDSSHAIFFEGVTWDWVGVGFTDVPGGSAWRNKSVLSYHFYVPPDFSMEVQFAARMHDMQRLQCGAFLTEFYADASVMAKCDEDHQSWMIWTYKPYIPSQADNGGGDGWLWWNNGTMNLDTARLWSRTYAQIVAGTTITQRYDNNTQEYLLVFVSNPLVTKNISSIYLNEWLHYSQGFNVSVTTSLGPQYALWRYAGQNHVEIEHDMDVVIGNETVTVTISPITL